MAIGTANPPNVIDQVNFADFYFRMTSSEDKQELKEKFKLICVTSLLFSFHLSSSLLFFAIVLL